jgi:hypothetical protein
MHSKHHSKPLFVFRKNKVLIMPNPKDQNKLCQAGGMTDCNSIAFHNMLKEVTSFCVWDQNNMLAIMWWKGLCMTSLYIIWPLL